MATSEPETVSQALNSLQWCRPFLLTAFKSVNVWTSHPFSALTAILPPMGSARDVSVLSAARRSPKSSSSLAEREACAGFGSGADGSDSTAAVALRQRLNCCKSTAPESEMYLEMKRHRSSSDA
eukprot:3010850-Rhodomonas_salina.1